MALVKRKNRIEHLNLSNRDTILISERFKIDINKKCEYCSKLTNITEKNKLNQILSTYENELGMFKNDLIDYLIVSVNESGLPVEQSTAHTNVINSVRLLLTTLNVS